eukprot:GHVS01005777.1.p1 GENE.GHVS01005777.1~~GHVS01005777.1.p1  ORF type:complete len:345 (-),score=3.90 GHVS01005777.1:202-1236(-)
MRFCGTALAFMVACVIKARLSRALPQERVYSLVAAASNKVGNKLQDLKAPLSVPPEKAAKLPVPILPISGACPSNSSYVISSTEQLLNSVSELECIYAVALPVDRVPLGNLYGRIIAFANSAFWNPVIELFYQGDHVVQTKCDNKTIHLNVLKFAGLPLATGLFYLGRMRHSVDPAEGFVDSEGLVMDFSVDIAKLCPGIRSPKQMKLFRPFLSDINANIYPVTFFQDHARAVGRDSDGCLILLGRTFLRDPLNLERSLVTAWYFTLKSCDPTVNQSLKRFDPLPTLATGFSYSRTGALEVLRRVNPFSAMLAEFMRKSLAGENDSEIGKALASPWNNTFLYGD